MLTSKEMAFRKEPGSYQTVNKVRLESQGSLMDEMQAQGSGSQQFGSPRELLKSGMQLIAELE
jgi:hypothetical protein